MFRFESAFALVVLAHACAREDTRRETDNFKQSDRHRHGANERERASERRSERDMVRVLKVAEQGGGGTKRSKIK